MGHSISTPIKNKTAKDEMLDFLDRHLVQPGVTFTHFLNKHWTLPLILKACYPEGSMSNVPDIPGSLNLVADGDLDHGHGRCRIGYNQGPIPAFERDFRWALVSWIALQAGKRKIFAPPPMKAMASILLIQDAGLGSLPVIHWDDEVIPVLPIKELKERPKKDEKWLQHLVDTWGVRIGPRNPGWTETDLLIRIPVREFISRLESGWLAEGKRPRMSSEEWTRLQENTVLINHDNPPITIPHGALEKLGDSAFKRECPFCGLGLFFVGRNQKTHRLLRQDRCCICGQSVTWSDADSLWGNEVEPNPEKI